MSITTTSYNVASKKTFLGSRSNTVVVPDSGADQYFPYTSLLMHGDGANNGTNASFLDSSPSNFTVTKNGNATQGSFSPYSQFGWSAYFNGSNDRVSTSSVAANAFGTADFTIECWVNLTGTISTYQRIWQFSDDNDNLELSSSTLRVGGASQGVLITSGTITGNTWMHIALVRASGVYKLYLNGTATGSSPSNSYNSGNRSIGLMSLASGGSYATGFMSNFRIVKSAVYTSNFTPSTAPLTAITNTSFLTLQDNRIKDNSANNLTLTLGGAPAVQPTGPFSADTSYLTTTNGGSMYFGSGNYLSVSMAASSYLGTQNYTIEGWIYPTNGSPTQAVASFGSGAWRLFYDNTRVWLLNGAGQLATVTTPGNQWIYVSVTRTGTGSNQCYLHVNGVATSFTDATNHTTGTSLTIGSEGAGNYMLGYISGFKFRSGSAAYSSASYTPPTTPISSGTDTVLLLNATNAAIFDNATKNDLQLTNDTKTMVSINKFGSSIYFDGTGDYITLPLRPTFQLGSADFTVEFWAYMNNVSTLQQFCYFNGSSGGYPGLGIQITSGGKIGCSASETGSSFKFDDFSTGVGSALSISTWYHIAVVRTGATLTVYINGTSAGTYSFTASTTSINSAITANYIGTYNAASRPLNAYIDDMRVTIGVARYTAGFSAPTEPFRNR